jgi:hypothetical protein
MFPSDGDDLVRRPSVHSETLVEQLSKLAVNVNGLMVPGRSLEATLARHAFNLVVSNEDEIYKVLLVGSATAVRVDGRYILLCTRHQLKDVDPRQVAMLKDDGSLLVTSGGMRWYSPSSETDAYDIAAFDFTKPVRDHPDLKKRFFAFSTLPPDTLNVNVMAVLLTGFPSSSQLYDLHERNSLGFRYLNIACLPEGQPTDPALLMLKAPSPINVDPDGMSGGSAFVIQYVNGELHAFFAGIVLRGGRQTFHILKSGFVLAFLDSVFDA